MSVILIHRRFIVQIMIFISGLGFIHISTSVTTNSDLINLRRIYGI